VKLLIRKVRKELGPNALRGTEKPEGSDARQAVLVLYKDLYDVSVCVNDFDLGWDLAQHSFTDNTKKIRCVFRDWAKTQFILGDKDSWDHAARNTQKLKGLEKVNLWMDSTDIPMAHREGWKRSGDFWSGKTKHWAQRFQVLMDASGKILRLWGGYSP